MAVLKSDHFFIDSETGWNFFLALFDVCKDCVDTGIVVFKEMFIVSGTPFPVCVFKCIIRTHQQECTIEVTLHPPAVYGVVTF